MKLEKSKEVGKKSGIKEHVNDACTLGGLGGGGISKKQEKLTRYIQVCKIDMKMGCLSLLEPSEYCLMDIE